MTLHIIRSHTQPLVFGEGLEIGPAGPGGRPPTIIYPTNDTYIREGAADTAYHTGPYIQVAGGAGARYNGLMLPDLSTVLPGSISATLTLTLAAVAGAAASTVTIYRILAANTGWVAACTWNFADGAGASDRWAGDAGADGGADAGCSVAGTDYNAAAIGSFVIAGLDPAGTVYNVALDLAQFQAQVAANYGWLLTASLTTTRGLAASNNATPAWRPYLTVTYT